jgi:hypothetical protein
MKLAILIPTLEKRKDLYDRAVTELHRQISIANAREDVFIFHHADNGKISTGTKRNYLIETAVSYRAEYIAFMDDDDMPGPTYIQRGIEVANSGMDCGELWGQIYWSGKPGKPFHHAVDIKEWWEDDKFYYRCPNHLNFMKLDLVKDVKFPDQVFGEDGQWSMAIKEQGLLKTEYKIPEVIYHYFCGQPKHAL